MIIEVKEYNYRGFTLYHVENKGWKIVLGDEEYLFPHCQAAETAIDAFIREVIPQHEGKKLRKTKA